MLEGVLASTGTTKMSFPWQPRHRHDPETGSIVAAVYTPWDAGKAAAGAAGRPQPKPPAQAPSKDGPKLLENACAAYMAPKLDSSVPPCSLSFTSALWRAQEDEAEPIINIRYGNVYMSYTLRERICYTLPSVLW